MSNIYKITAKGVTGALYMSYRGGYISECWFRFDPFLDATHQALLLAHMPYAESSLNQLRQNTPFDYEALTPRNVSDKLAMFCMSFRNYRNSPYTAQKIEKANLADVVVTKQLMDVYFSMTDYPLNYAKSITDYIKNYNLIRDLAANGKPVRNGFPDVYDREYERGLEGEKLSAYWQHLGKLGWRKIDGMWTNQTPIKF